MSKSITFSISWRQLAIISLLKIYPLFLVKCITEEAIQGNWFPAKPNKLYISIVSPIKYKLFCSLKGRFLIHRHFYPIFIVLTKFYWVFIKRSSFGTLNYICISWGKHYEGGPQLWRKRKGSLFIEEMWEELGSFWKFIHEKILRLNLEVRLTNNEYTYDIQGPIWSCCTF